MNYPDEFIRGISSKDFMDEEGYPNALIFNKFDPNPERDDDYNEVSINWYDCEEALKILLNQKKENGELQFKWGCAILPTSDLDKLCKKPQFSAYLSFERRVVPGNTYHGNILVKKNTIKGKINMIASVLAASTECVKVIEKEE